MPEPFDQPKFYDKQPRSKMKFFDTRQEKPNMKAKAPDKNPSSANSPRRDKYTADVKIVDVDAEVEKTLNSAPESAGIAAKK